MALDGIVVHAIVNELQSCIGGRIGKIHLPSKQDILLQIRAQNSNHRLLLSANPTYPRVHMTEHTYPNPQDAPMFCMLLRKHCEGGIIERIEQVGFERIINIHVRHRDELGDMSQKIITIEIMGKHSNVILLDPTNGDILDGLHHVTPAISSHRVVLPGSTYVAPPDQGKHNPLTTSKAQFLEWMLAPIQPVEQTTEQLLRHLFEGAEEPPELPKEENLSVNMRMVKLFSGISPLIANEIVYRGKKALESTYADNLLEFMSEEFVKLMQQISAHNYAPNIVTISGSGKTAFSVVELTHLSGEVQSFPSVSHCLEGFYGDKAEKDTVKQRMSDLLRLLQNERNKNIKKLEKLEETIAEAKEADRIRLLGELLTASMHLVKKGDKQVEVINYYDEDQKTLMIPLDPLLTPSENAQRYFRKYNKSKNSLIVVEQQIQSTHEEIRYLESIQQQIGSATLSDITEIREELVGQGYVRDRSKIKKKKKKEIKPSLSCFTSSEGISIYVGKNNTQNEYLTNRLAQSSDTWLHTKDIPGSHVVIRSVSFGDQTLLEAAQLSAYFSQAKHSSQVPVDYTFIRHVHKPSGAKPGFVIYDHQKTVFVTPNESTIKQMKVELKS